MKLNKSNYFSLDADRHYMSVSQFKSFLPVYGGCEARAMAKLHGEYVQKETDAFLIGKYVHAWNEGTLAEFKADNPSLYSSRGSTAGQLKSEFKAANVMIEKLESDSLIMKALAGQKEVIFTAELFGLEWKIMIDSYQPNFTAAAGIFTDLKTTQDLNKLVYNSLLRQYEHFIVAYGYNVQFAVYAEIEKQATGRDEWLIPHMVAITKQDPPDKELYQFDYEDITAALNIVRNNIDRVKEVKSGKALAVRCEECDYCRSTKRIIKPKRFAELAVY
ncbi:PD-(D/E)XK nuclease-like domain-containing protein [Paenibacillus sp. IITD108]|uniref:PD-(D/E)XK nuclease-like domain-containing protein n=1 Tax=Paenibacillus sp. IITD108 TaxID=3116649 RepID=UPI002F4062EB